MNPPDRPLVDLSLAAVFFAKAFMWLSLGALLLSLARWVWHRVEEENPFRP